MTTRPLTLAIAAGAALAAGTVVMRSTASPTLLPAGAPGAFGFTVGEMVYDFSFHDTAGETGRLSKLLERHEAVVVAFTGAECAAASHVAPVEERFGESSVYFVHAAADVGDNQYLVSALQPRSAAEVFVIDDARTLRYRGGTHFADEALDAVLLGKHVEVAETKAADCSLRAARAGVPERAITYHNRVSRIIQANCALCHRDGGIAPFSLESYEMAHAMRERMRTMVAERRMPPWYASPEYGDWKNDRRLSERDYRDLLAWIDAGAPEGDADDAPLERRWIYGFQLDEEPDTIIQIPEPMEVPAEGVLEYQYLYVKTDFPEDRWIQQAEIRPTAREVTHHIIAYQEAPEDTTRGDWLVGYAPGVPPTILPENAGRLLPAGGWIMFELHYTTIGRPMTDRAQLALTFADGEPERQYRTRAVGNTEFEIPPGAENHEVVAELEFERPGQIHGLLPHMHLRGKAFRIELVHPDGTEDTLLHVSNYDFNWQIMYEPLEPIRIEPGMLLRGRAWYDNSEANPKNPDPTVSVKWGEQSFEEMMYGFFEWSPDPRNRESKR